MKSKTLFFSLMLFLCATMVNMPVTIAQPKVNAAPATLTLGGLFPETGALAAGGVEREAAAKIAVEEINANTTLLPNTVLKLSTRDTATTPATGATAAQDLIDSGVFGLVGAASSGVSEAIQAKAAVAHVPQISYSSTAAALSNKTLYPYFLRVVPPDAQQALAIKALVDNFGWKNVATLATSDDYGKGGIQGIEAVINGTVKVLTSQQFQTGATDVSGNLQAIVDSGAKVIIINMVVEDAKTVFAQAAAAGITPANGYVWVGTDGPTQEQVFANSTAAKDAMKGMIGTRPNTGSGAIYDAFVTKWSACDGKDATVYPGCGPDNPPNTYATFAYDAVYAFAIAAQKLIDASKDPQSGPDMLATLKALSFHGATGKVTFDSNQDRNGIYDVVNLQGDTFKVVGSFNKLDGLSLSGTVTWPDGSTSVPTDGGAAPGFGLTLAFATIGFVAIVADRRRRK